ncbi:hypothetical protein PISL3812_07770 [Talaromyces islandicus]|uniref:DNL-type domain-containing protein n=1 Tax=Talaromyces islandicus TaxID=28573 RepID=A0A0U1M5A3_TALIS|nr:hypothetical protein PISL3812_07770 [Talaromyces islandicus]
MRSSTTLLRSLRMQSTCLPRIRAATRIPSPFQTARPALISHKPAALAFIRYNSSSSSNARSPRPLTDHTSDPTAATANEEQNAARRAEEPAYQISFTCKPCGTRSTHRMSKHGYHKGTVLIACPSCKNRHIIADHLGIFLDDKTTLEDILAKQGTNVTKGYLEGDMEFWEDGSVYKTGGNEASSSEASTKDSS